MSYDYVSGVFKGSSTPSPNWALRYGNAQSGNLTTIYDSAFSTTWKLLGGIVLGIGGDNGNKGLGTFFEGAITSGRPADSSDDAVQRTIVAAYGNTTEANRAGVGEVSTASPFKVHYNQSSSDAVISFAMHDTHRVSMHIFSQRGRRIAAVVDGVFPAGRHEAIWCAKGAAAGIYVCRTTIDGVESWTGKIIIGK